MIQHLRRSFLVIVVTIALQATAQRTEDSEEGVLPGLCSPTSANRQVKCQNPTPCNYGSPVTTNWGGKTIEFFPGCKDSWDDAQAHCMSRGGKLWEPVHLSEYNGVFANIGYNQGTNSPAWLWEYMHWWIGYRNPDGAGQDAILATEPIITCNDCMAAGQADLGHDCVVIHFNKDTWGDHPCSGVPWGKSPFICEKPKECEQSQGCFYNGKVYLDGLIEMKKHCCEKVYCEKGQIRTVQLFHPVTRLPLSDCCIHKNNLVAPGFSKNYVCCNGRYAALQSTILPTKF